MWAQKINLLISGGFFCEGEAINFFLWITIEMCLYVQNNWRLEQTSIHFKAKKLLESLKVFAGCGGNLNVENCLGVC